MPKLTVKIILREDNSGLPGQPIYNNVINLGQTFFLEVLIGDIRPRAKGILSSFIDIDFDARILRNIDIPFEPFRLNQGILNSKLVYKPSGNLDNLRGIITNLGATAVPPFFGMPLGINRLERFSLLHFRTLKEGDSNLKIRFNLESTIFVNNKFADINSQKSYIQPISVVNKINSQAKNFFGVGSPVFFGLAYKEKLFKIRKNNKRQLLKFFDKKDE